MGARVLIAHGDTQQLEEAVRNLTTAGFEVVATPDGGDAFARFFEESPDLVVCSESLPVLDGRSFGRMIRSQTPSVPVVLLVSQSPEAPDEEFMLLEEPLDVARLSELVPAIKPVARAAEMASPADSGDPLCETLTSFQRQGNLLALLDQSGLERFAHIATLQACKSGYLVIQEGDPCDGFYLVVKGEVRVTLAERGDEEVARLGSGEFFGEMALLSDQPRSASVWTCQESELLFFERDAVLDLLQDYPDLRELLGGVALQRAEENLWQALSGDDDVQRNLSGLLEGLEEEDGVASVEISVGEQTVPSLSVAPASAPAQPSTHAQINPLSAGVAASDAEAEDIDVTLPSVAGNPIERLRMGIRNTIRLLRLYSLRHQFGAGMTFGAIAGVLVMVVTLTVLVNGEPEMPTAPEVVTEQSGRSGDEFGVVAKTEHEQADESAATQAGPDGESQVPEAGDSAADDEEAGVPDDAVAEQDSDEPEDDATAETRQARVARKALRRKLFDAYNEERHEEVVGLGLKLEKRFDLDWEAQFTLAQAARQVGDNELALKHYLEFAEKYRSNVYADDAQFWAAKVLASEGRLHEARDLFRLVADNPSSKLRHRARRRVEELSK
ncbi:cyclic nucleotide-binding domain-containing protein [Myxococcota bacterium]